MSISREETAALARTVGLSIPEADMEDLTARINFFFLAIEELEADLGEGLYRFEPVPPVFPQEDF